MNSEVKFFLVVLAGVVVFATAVAGGFAWSWWKRTEQKHYHW